MIWAVAYRVPGGRIGGGATGNAGRRLTLSHSPVINKIDSKGRLSVPSGFRSVLAAAGSPGLYCYPSLDEMTLEACSERKMQQIDNMISKLQATVAKKLRRKIFGEGEMLLFDPEGRVRPSPALLAKKGITDEVMFVGLGNTFQLWNPAHYADEGLITDEDVGELVAAFDSLTLPAEV
ncbi:MAG: hypothetical protein AAGB03_00085 [Pseudomonadota bacterium]